MPCRWMNNVLIPVVQYRSKWHIDSSGFKVNVWSSKVGQLLAGLELGILFGIGGVEKSFGVQEQLSGKIQPVPWADRWVRGSIGRKLLITIEVSWIRAARIGGSTLELRDGHGGLALRWRDQRGGMALGLSDGHRDLVWRSSVQSFRVN